MMVDAEERIRLAEGRAKIAEELAEQCRKDRDTIWALATLGKRAILLLERIIADPDYDHPQPEKIQRPKDEAEFVRQARQVLHDYRHR